MYYKSCLLFNEQHFLNKNEENIRLLCNYESSHCKFTQLPHNPPWRIGKNDKSLP